MGFSDDIPLPKLHHRVMQALEQREYAKYIENWTLAKRTEEEWAEIFDRLSETYERRVKDIETFI